MTDTSHPLWKYERTVMERNLAWSEARGYWDGVSIVTSGWERMERTGERWRAAYTEIMGRAFA